MPEPPAYDESAEYRLVASRAIYHRPSPESTRSNPEAACGSHRFGKPWRVLDLDNPRLDECELCGSCERGCGPSDYSHSSPSEAWVRLSEGSPEDFGLSGIVEDSD